MGDLEKIVDNFVGQTQITTREYIWEPKDYLGLDGFYEICLDIHYRYDSEELVITGCEALSVNMGLDSLGPHKRYVAEVFMDNLPEDIYDYMPTRLEWLIDVEDCSYGL